jgi:hypothetical protein
LGSKEGILEKESLLVPAGTSEKAREKTDCCFCEGKLLRKENYFRPLGSNEDMKK